MNFTFLRRSIVAVMVLVVAAVAFSLLPSTTTYASDPEIGTAAQITDLSDLYEQVSPSVVAISVLTEFGGGSGSGFVIDKQGHIVTNNHVVDGAQRIEVNFLDGTLALAEIVGQPDPDSDIAVIRVQNVAMDRLHPITFGDSSALRVGQPVVALGSPFGQRWTMTSGIVSALDRTIQGLDAFRTGGVIQTDAAINPGNSGGPLFNLDGQVVGVNSQIRSASGTSSGVGFAVPSNLVRRVATEILQEGRVQYAYLGIGGTDVSLPLIDALGIPNDTRGVVVSRVEPNTPAARANLQNPSNRVIADGVEVPVRVDIITAVDGREVIGIDDLIGYLAQYTRPGDTVTLTVLRNGNQRLDIPVTLAPRP